MNTAAHLSWRSIAVLAATLPAVSCGGDGGGDDGSGAADGVEPDAPVELADGLTVRDIEIDGLRTVTAGCPALVGRGVAGGRRVHVALNGERCATDGDMIAENGNYGDYLSPADVLAESLMSDVSVSEHPLGTLSAFDHAYVECTNDCVTDVSPMILFELDDPLVVDGVNYPTLVLRGMAMAADELAAIADSITRD